MEKFFQKSKEFSSIKCLQMALVIVIAVSFLFRADSSVLLLILIVANLAFLLLDLTKYRKALAESDEIKKTTYQDELTGIPNHYSCDQIFYKYSTEDSVRHVGCALIVIDNLVAINDEFGREAGNIAIIDFCHILQDVGEEFGFIGRNGGNEFLLVIEQCDKRIMEKFFSKLKVRMERYNALELNHPIDFRYEYVLNEDLKLQRFSNMITEVYQRVYE